MFRRRLSFGQLAFATVLGVAGGIYIYSPYFESAPKTSGQQIQEEPKKQNERD
ncbi:protein PIGBOS1 [Archocentrus centrarchus]|uniref:protein PIGBOS1 n=1 Tax=Archocentrus centrarchus TaxID=63155 RepID=UPI0011EA1EFC|nr:protein PIGBOS1 [Archocentrus centrarchus]XP_030578185.1 protein PIGBOS1 [Archocentrus centrarchus]